MVMNVLIACEESQRTCREFRKLGHNAFSCDLQPCSMFDEAAWHINGDALEIINGRTTFITQDGQQHEISGTWDLIIAHPPCTFLTVTGNRWFNVERYGAEALQRERERERRGRGVLHEVYNRRLRTYSH